LTCFFSQIIATADSLQMVVDPGQEKVPAEDVQAQNVKINMVYPGDVHSIKRNTLPSSVAFNKAKNGKETVTHRGRRRQSKKSLAKRMAKRVLKHSRWTGSMRQSISREKTKKHFHHRHHQSKTIVTKNVAATKKSNVNEKEMRIHGQSGHLHVHTDHNVTAVDSKSGKLEIYIKNPDHKFGHEHESAEHHGKVKVEVFAEEAYKKNRLEKNPSTTTQSRQLHMADYTGVKKSQLIPSALKHSGDKFDLLKTRNFDHKIRTDENQRLPCVVPPCSN
jgi:hypothetical protein